MNIACIGTGFIGVVTTAVFANLGHQVTGVDIDEKKIESLKKGQVPFFEPGLKELLIKTQQSGKLTFTTSYKQAISCAEIVMIMVGTPSNKDGSANLQYIFSAAESLAPYLQTNAIVVIKSTVPPGTNKIVEKIIKKQTKVKFFLASLPEFLKEGTAVADTLHPDRVIIGSTEPSVIAKLKKLHTPLTNNILVMNAESAQMTKYGSNLYLATRISFANELADLCEHTGADIEEVLRGIGQDKRIGSHYWYPGLGYGGSCFPKDVKEIVSFVKKIGDSDSLFITLDKRNEARIPRLMQKFAQQIGGFKDKTVAVLGLSFKKNTNDTRVAPSLQVVPWLLDHGAKVTATDPKAIKEAQKLLPKTVKYFPDPYKTCEAADIVLLLVEWDEYLNLDLHKLSKIMRPKKVFIDTRNQYEPQLVKNAGFTYLSIGR